MGSSRIFQQFFVLYYYFCLFVTGLALRDGLLVSGNADSTVKVWNVTDGSCVHTLTGPNKHQVGGLIEDYKVDLRK